MDCSIIIVNWNVGDLLRQCLRSIETHGNGLVREVWVVDNGSTDHSVAMLRKEFPAVHAIANSDNRGFAAAANQGLRQASGDYLLLLNSDTELTSGCLRVMISVLETHPNIGLVGPRLVGLDGRLQPSCARNTTPGREFAHHLRLDRILPGRQYPVHRWPLEQLRDVDVLQGACWLMRRAMLDQIGRLDESYYMYSEDDDLCERSARAGWRRVWCPMATVVHRGGASTRLDSDAMLQRYYRSKFLFYRRFRSRAQQKALRFLLFLNLGLIIAAGQGAALFPGARARRMATLGKRYRLLAKNMIAQQE